MPPATAIRAGLQLLLAMAQRPGSKARRRRQYTGYGMEAQSSSTVLRAYPGAADKIAQRP